MQFWGVKKWRNANIFFRHQTETYLLRCWSTSSSTSSELKFIKWVRLFEQDCIVKCVTFFVSFCCSWNFLLENLKLKRNSGDFHWNIWTNIKTLYERNKLFKKKKSKYEIWKFIFWYKFRFWGTALGCFNQCYFFFNILSDILLSPLPPPTIKKLPTGLRPAI